jgi:hypothetical protein
MPLVPIDVSTPSTDGNAYVGPAGADFLQLLPHFRKDVSGKWRGKCQIPDDYATGGTVRLSIMANAASGVTRLSIGYAFVADGEDLDPTLTGVAAQDVTVPTTALRRKDVSFSVTGAAPDDILLVEIHHEGAHANDTLAVDTILADAVFLYAV